MRLGMIGFGNISQTVVGLLRDTLSEPLQHLSLLTREGGQPTTQTAVDALGPALAAGCSIVTCTRALMATKPDLVVECAGHYAVIGHCEDILRAGCDVVLVSIGALSNSDLHARLLRAASDGGARLILPAGAIGGIDLLSALRTAPGLEVTYRGIKPPAAWRGSPAEEYLDLDQIAEPAVFFSGTAREAASAFPKNANVAATLALAGTGFENTRAELIADPTVSTNIHEYSVSSNLAKYSVRIENKPSAGNAKTSLSTAYSVLREITNRIGPVAI